ncbi:phosphoribosylaminoimidazole carboxylase [Vigna unguiculata]|uniref:phosphoribosylaminoimidazole carboxylase n=1 Tax=Vigna unguiculata TaxID=3917 RepID=A0A4D6MWS4_VIGUN|nr:phosphoribosylaminoimidazole carboxylase [Vigna unguiculata]
MFLLRSVLCVPKDIVKGRRRPRVPNPKVLIDYLQSLKSFVVSLKQQIEKEKRKEDAFMVTFAKREKYMKELKMPRGVPVATVTVNNATNAGLLAVRMLGVANDNILSRALFFINMFKGLCFCW